LDYKDKVRQACQFKESSLVDGVEGCLPILLNPWLVWFNHLLIVGDGKSALESSAQCMARVHPAY